MHIEKIGNATLYNADCVEVLPSLEKVDAVVTDPPYGVGLEYDSFIDTKENVAALMQRWLPLALEIANRVVLTPGNIHQRIYPEPTWTLAWVVPAGSGRGPWGFTCWQPILAYGPDPYLSEGYGSQPDIIQHIEASEKNGHPCPKPIMFMQKLITRASLRGTICDPFMGSGTTGVAASILKRKFIGIELSPKYFDIACRRIEEANKQPGLF